MKLKDFTCKQNQLNNSLLKRYWFETSKFRGVGITAYSLSDANFLFKELCENSHINYQVLKIVEDVDIRNLDQNHIIPNMGAPDFRGIWYPNINL